ncbi:hypothetical protein IEO21_09645 [Rhodonia placenta]|uniref:Uncharacterized protein n=1 Tax=Rhodonia placenta TaxID=104341 RepID=A0A8H7NTW2_9APHY|nr:hypothetical protein IEO21_09645 [Postia placenta]
MAHLDHECTRNFRSNVSPSWNQKHSLLRRRQQDQKAGSFVPSPFLEQRRIGVGISVSDVELGEEGLSYWHFCGAKILPRHLVSCLTAQRAGALSNIPTYMTSRPPGSAGVISIPRCIAFDDGPEGDEEYTERGVRAREAPARSIVILIPRINLISAHVGVIIGDVFIIHVPVHVDAFPMLFLDMALQSVLARQHPGAAQAGKSLVCRSWAGSAETQVAIQILRASALSWATCAEEGSYFGGVLAWLALSAFVGIRASYLRAIHPLAGSCCEGLCCAVNGAAALGSPWVEYADSAGQPWWSAATRTTRMVDLARVTLISGAAPFAVVHKRDGVERIDRLGQHRREPFE